MKSLGPSFPFYVDDFIGGTQHMTAAEIGAYVLLLCHQWREGSLPSNPSLLTRICRQRIDRMTCVLDKFPVCDDGLRRNPRMDIVRCERAAYVAMQSEKGKRSAANRGSTVVEKRLQPKGNSPSPSPKEDIQSPPDGGTVPDQNPTLEDCIQASATIGMTKKSIEAFFHHFNAVGWIDAQGRKIKNLPSALAKWKANEGNHGPNGVVLTKRDEPIQDNSHLDAIIREACS